MKVVRRAVGTAIVVAFVIVIIAGAAGAYLLLARTGTSASTSTSSSTSSSSSTQVTSYSTTTATLSTSSSSTSTSPSSSSSSATSTSTTSTQTTTCSSTTSTTTGSFSTTFNFTRFFNDYSSMSLHYNGTEMGNSYNVSSTYTVLDATPKGFRVNTTLGSGGTVARFAFFAWRNGSAAWVYGNGHNETGSFAVFGYLQAMSAFLFEALFTSPDFVNAVVAPGLVHVVGTSEIMIGNTMVNVTSYAPTTLPLVTSSCGGTSVDFTKFSIQLGMVAGKTATILAHFAIKGTFTGSGSNLTIDLTQDVTSLTKS